MPTNPGASPVQTAPPWLRRTTGPAAVIAILGLFWCLLSASLWDKSITYDELVHATAGYTYWKFDDFRINPENGNLPQRLAAIPLLGGRFPFPDLESTAWRTPDEWSLGDLWFNRMGNDTAAMLREGRAAAGLQAVAIAALVWWCSRRIFGRVGAMVSLLACALNPTVLANGALMTSDAAAALFFLAATWAWWSMLHRLTPARVALSSLAMGCLFVSKMSAALIIPIALVLTVARLLEGRPLPAGVRTARAISGRRNQLLAISLAAAIHAVAVFATIWGFYGFRYAAFAPGSPNTQGSATMWNDLTRKESLPEMVGELGLASGPLQQARQLMDSRTVPLFEWNADSDAALQELKQSILTQDQAKKLDDLVSGAASSRSGGIVGFFRQNHVLPEAYVLGSLHAWRFAQMRNSFFNGEFLRFGSIWFFPTTFVVKTPIATFGLLAFALAAAVYGWKTAARRGGRGLQAFLGSFYATLPLWALLGFYWTAVLGSHLNIGHRHIMATYPPLFVLCGAAGVWLESWLLAGAAPGLKFSPGARNAGIAVASLLAVQALEIAGRFPNFISYFNGIVAPSEGYRHFVDSTIDWGQDLPGVRSYMNAHAAAGPFYLSYFGNGDPRTYGIAGRFLPSNPGRFLSDTPPVIFKLLPANPPATLREQLAKELPDYEYTGDVFQDNRGVALLVKKPEALQLTAGTYFISATNLQPNWRETDEGAYQELERNTRSLRGLGVPGGQDSIPKYTIVQWRDMILLFEKLRLGRLTAFLRRYTPDGNIGHSILVYKLTEADLNLALSGPSPEAGPYFEKTLRESHTR